MASATLLSLLMGFLVHLCSGMGWSISIFSPFATRSLTKCKQIVGLKTKFKTLAVLIEMLWDLCMGVPHGDKSV